MEFSDCRHPQNTRQYFSIVNLSKPCEKAAKIRTLEVTEVSDDSSFRTRETSNCFAWWNWHISMRKELGVAVVLVVFLHPIESINSKNTGAPASVFFYSPCVTTMTVHELHDDCTNNFPRNLIATCIGIADSLICVSNHYFLIMRDLMQGAWVPSRYRRNWTLRNGINADSSISKMEPESTEGMTCEIKYHISSCSQYFPHRWDVFWLFLDISGDRILTVAL